MTTTRTLARAATLAVAVLALVAPTALAGTLTVVDTEQYNGTYGLEVDITDTTPTYVETDSPQSEVRFRARFYVKATKLTLGSGADIIVMSAVGGGNDQVRVLVEESGGQHLLFFEVREDGGGYQKTATGVTLPDGWRAVEFDWQRSDGSNNGTLDFWMDGWSAAELSATGLSGLDNDAQVIDYARMGAVGSIDAPSDQLYFDDFEAHRDTAINLLSLFSDVAVSHWSWEYVHAIHAIGSMEPCAPGNFCRTGTITRAEIAKFIIRTKYGEYYVPPDATGIFNDVPAGDPYAPWIEKLYNDGTTVGCGNNNYCPDDLLSRAHMAAFMLRALHGGGYEPPAPTGTVFNDVSLGMWSAKWVEQAYAEGLTDGCGAGNYCPTNDLSRAQTAKFLTDMFTVPLLPHVGP